MDADQQKIYIATAMRLLLLPVLYCGLLLLFGANELTFTVALVTYATPLG